MNYFNNCDGNGKRLALQEQYTNLSKQMSRIFLKDRDSRNWPKMVKIWTKNVCPYLDTRA